MNLMICTFSLNYCMQCSNSQLSVVVPPEKMFDEYLYLSSTSQQFKNHFIELNKWIKIDLNSEEIRFGDIGKWWNILRTNKQIRVKSYRCGTAKNVAKIANSKN